MKMRSPGRTFLLALLLVGLAACTVAQPTTRDAALAATPTELPSPTPTADPKPEGYVEYSTQSGDTLAAVASHFGVEKSEIIFADETVEERLLPPGTRLYIPALLGSTTPSELLIPDSDVVFSPSTIGFDTTAFVNEKGGKLSTYTELMTRGTTPGAEILYQLAQEYSINPRLLLSLLEYQSGWVTGDPQTPDEEKYPYGFIKADKSQLYKQLGLAIRQLEIGYYGWRAGTLTELTFTDGTTLRLAPNLNAGTVAVMQYFASVATPAEWQAALYGDGSFPQVHTALFGDAWERAATVEPLFPAGTLQPEMNLPFSEGQVWNYTCGPHEAWGNDGPAAALDFAPPLDRSGCGTSNRWALAAATGLVVRSGTGLLVLDLDGDGYEQTGWELLYMHLSSTGKPQVGQWVKQDERVGHPSCDGGSSSGIHIHLARKYNGEWVLADGGLPFVLSGYEAHDKEKFCEGTLENGGKVVEAYPWGNYLTKITRPEATLEPPSGDPYQDGE
jgi:murein DD-endopeptidase MepM/ murein hydrolase activator NlpD